MFAINPGKQKNKIKLDYFIFSEKKNFEIIESRTHEIWLLINLFAILLARKLYHFRFQSFEKWIEFSLCNEWTYCDSCCVADNLIACRHILNLLEAKGANDLSNALSFELAVKIEWLSISCEKNALPMCQLVVCLTIKVQI